MSFHILPYPFRISKALFCIDKNTKTISHGFISLDLLHGKIFYIYDIQYFRLFQKPPISHFMFFFGLIVLGSRL
jgi:hypothetical protein